MFVHVMNAAGVLFQCLLSDDEMLTYSVPISDVCILAYLFIDIKTSYL